jgi:predicted Zn-dependent peptidase
MTTPPAIRTTVLDSGVTVVSELMPSALSICTAVWVGVGSRDETPEQAGCSHFLEHLAFKGTKNRSALELAQSIDEVGGEMNAFTTKEHTTYYVRTVAEDAELAIEILGDILTRPALRDDDVASEKQVILEEIAMRADEPADLVHDTIHELIFGDHPLGRDIAGSPDTVKGLMSGDIRTFLDATYAPKEIVVAAAGLVDHDQLVKDVELHLQRPASAGPTTRQRPDGVARRLDVVTDDTEQVHLVVALPGLARNDDDRFAAGLLDHVLGGGMSSRLFQEIREKRGLAYSVYSYRSAYADGGYLGVYAGCAPARLVEVADLIGIEFDRLRADGITADELRRAKSSVRGSVALGMEDSGSRMSRIGRSQLLHGEIRPIEDILKQTDDVTLADVRAVIDRLFAAPSCVALVGPVEADVLTGHALVA